MFSFLMLDELSITAPKVTKFHYEIQIKDILNNNKKEDYDFWSNKELDYISKIDLSTPLKDDEDYSKW